VEKPAHLVLVSYFDDLFNEDAADAPRASGHTGRLYHPEDGDTVVPFAPLPSESLEPAIPEAAVLPMRRPLHHRPSPAHEPPPPSPQARSPHAPVMPESRASETSPQRAQTESPRSVPVAPPPMVEEAPAAEQPAEAPVSAQVEPPRERPEADVQTAPPVAQTPAAMAPMADAPVASTSEHPQESLAPQYLCFELAGFEVLLEAGAVAEVRGVPMPERASSGWRCAEMALGRWEPLPLLDVQALVGRGPLPVDTGSMVTAVRLAEAPAVLLMPALPQLESLNATEVTWRGEHGARPWLAGTIRTRRAIVLDVAGLAELLKAH